MRSRKNTRNPNHADAEAPTCRVAIADDHPVVLRGLERSLRMDTAVHIVGATQTIGDTLALLKQHPCDVLICDYGFDGDPQPDGLALLKRLRRLHPQLAIILLSAHHDIATVKCAMNLGVLGFMRKSADTGHLPLAVRTVLAGRRYTDPATAEALLGDALGKPQAALPSVVLSAREMETMRFLQKGLRVSEIASITHRSVKTVSAQKNALMRKLGARSDMELFKILIRAF